MEALFVLSLLLTTRRRSASMFALLLRLAGFAAAAGILETPLLIGGFGHDRRHRQVFAVAVDSHKIQIGGADVAAGVFNIAFHPYLYAYFHRTVKGAVDRRF